MSLPCEKKSTWKDRAPLEKTPASILLLPPVLEMTQAVSKSLRGTELNGKPKEPLRESSYGDCTSSTSTGIGKRPREGRDAPCFDACHCHVSIQRAFSRSPTLNRPESEESLLWIAPTEALLRTAQDVALPIWRTTQASLGMPVSSLAPWLPTW